ncbi:copper homeostasis protein CutC [Leeuwenhoekiella sp. MAR_2009_132]|uniref:copper homeostasis protein CutC n=1 Tax=Leeuwenhoekiella sp. MAR_2009_132 TaxID=1392489 RepID=UPI00068CA899|nr:copper homeostasis protein CutC [Leeuwenhoekiella sp. MAR_2009_132]
MKINKEACVESVEQAVQAQRQGATRIELVSHYEVGGLTPSKTLITEVQQAVSIPIRVMIRPRAGGFNYTQEELDVMLSSIDECKELQVEGVVFGVLKADNTLDTAAIKTLTKRAYPLKVVIHKAIDETPDIFKALQKLLKIKGITTILTSGGKPNATEGATILKELIRIAGSQIEIMAQGEITSMNFEELHHIISANAYHGKYLVGEI